MKKSDDYKNDELLSSYCNRREHLRERERCIYIEIKEKKKTKNK